MKLEWFKKHPYAAGAAILAGLVVIYLIFRQSSSSSGGGLASLAAGQEQGQLQLAQLNEQASAQEQATQAQLASESYAAQVQETEQQNQEVGGLAETIIPAQLESELYKQELEKQSEEQTALMPLEKQALQISTQGNRAQTGQNELAILLASEGEFANPAFLSGAGGLPVQGLGTTSPTSFSLSPNSFGLTLGQGLFG
jgi:hypothetical protein